MHRLINFIYSLFFSIVSNKREKILHKKLSANFLFANWFFQRVLRINSGNKFSTNFTSKINVSGDLNIENDSLPIYLSLASSTGCYFAVHRGTKLSIGEGTLWAPNVCINTGNHGVIKRDEYSYGDIVIGKNCWLGFGVVVTAGVQLGDNVTVGANAVVTKSFGSNVVIGGVPAKIIRTL